MKVLVAILSLVSLSTTVFAATKCDSAVIEIAQANLDLKAKASQFSGSTIIEDSLKQLSSTKDGSLVYSVGGDIYKGEYSIEVQMDSFCSVETVRITEVGQ